MNRVIKFRAWIDNGVVKEIVYCDEIEMNSAAADALWYKVGFINRYPEKRVIEDWQKEIIWMQFTGLYDKNGKEIFEGDIINPVDGNMFSVINNSLERWDNFVVKTEGCDYILYNVYLKRNWGRLSRLAEINWNCIVIGNIHENPELIK